MLRDIFVSLFVLGLLPACFRKPFVGMLLFSMLAYMRLQDLTWGFAKYQRWSYFVAIAMIAGWLASRERTPIMRPDLRCWMMVALVGLVGVGILSSGMAGRSDVDAYLEFCKIIGIALFTTGLLTTVGRLRVLLWVVALSFGFYGVKSGIQGMISLGGLEILQGPGGMIFDRNDFALALTMALPMLFHLGWSEKRDVLRRVALACVPLTAMTIVFTHSRGAFLSLGATVAAMVWRSRNRLAGIAIMLLAAAAVFALAPQSYVERISTIGDFEEDSSAQGRLDAWVVAGNMITANPVLGVGYGKFERNYHTYDPKKALFLAGGTMGRVAHNSYLQIWAECGTIAFTLYMLMIAMTFFDMWRVRSAAQSRYHASWIISYANMFEASMVGFVVGSVFLNRAHFDLLYHVIAISLSFGYLARRAMEDEVRYPRRVELGRGTVATVRPAGFGRRPKAAGFRNTPLAPRGA